MVIKGCETLTINPDKPPVPRTLADISQPEHALRQLFLPHHALQGVVQLAERFAIMANESLAGPPTAQPPNTWERLK